MYGGFAVVLGPWVVHLLEAEEVLMNRFIKRLHEMHHKEQSYYANSWVLHYTEDVPQRAYLNWNSKMINTQSATREIKTLPDFEKMYTIYESMVKIGV